MREVIVGICILVTIDGSALFGQTTAAPARWVGTWALNVEKSSFGTPLVPGAPASFRITGQTLRIEQTTAEVRLSGETVYSDNNGSHASGNNNSLSLDGKPTSIGPISLSFRPINDSTFEIVSQLTVPGHNVEEVSHFSISGDGGTLTETKTQTEKDTKATSTSVLVFARLTTLTK